MFIPDEYTGCAHKNHLNTFFNDKNTTLTKFLQKQIRYIHYSDP